MKCPICAEETAGQETQQWGPEWAHIRCVKAYSLGGCDARAALREKLEHLQAIETLRRLIANDAHACTFQSLGQYRTALLAALSNTEVCGNERR